MLSFILIDDAAGRFAVDSATGRITVADSSLLDFESANTHSITVQATDSGGLSRQETFTIALRDVNEAPVAADDAFTGNQLKDLVAGVPGVTSNDFDIDGDGIAVVLVNGPGNGTLVLNANGSFTYTPNGVFSGVDSFEYIVTDGFLLSEVATVEITILTTVAGNPTQTAPVIETIESLENETTTETESQADDSADDESTVQETGLALAIRSPQVTLEEVDDGQVGIGQSQSSDILKSTNSELFITIFIDDVPETTSVSADRESRREQADNELRSTSMMSEFLFSQIQTANPFLGSTVFDITQTRYIEQRSASSFADLVLEKVIVGSSAAVSTSVSVGYAVWMLRGGSLLTSILSSLPVWQGFDPLPVLDSFEEEAEGDTETLASIASNE